MLTAINNRYIVQAPRHSLVELETDTHARQVVDLPIIGGAEVEVLPQDQAAFLKRAAELQIGVTPEKQVTIPEGERPEAVDAGQPRLELDIGTRVMGIKELHEAGFKGAGVGVAVVDTGVDTHKDLRGRIVAFHDIINGRTEAYDDQGHGTHVSGIAAGDGSSSLGYLEGVAPEASIIGVKVLDAGGSGTLAGVIRGIQWCIEHKDEYNIKVMNLSLGAGASQSHRDDPMAQAIAAAEAAGILPVVAAGNSGPLSRTIDSPGIAPEALTVGALNDANTPWRWDDGIAMFSSRGPTIDDLPKPDLVAPGAGITAPKAGGGYTRMSGTSMASPMVAGAAALMFEAHPDATPAQVKAALMETSDQMWGFSEKSQGRGVIQPAEAHRRLAQQEAGRLEQH